MKIIIFLLIDVSKKVERKTFSSMRFVSLKKLYIVQIVIIVIQAKRKATLERQHPTKIEFTVIAVINKDFIYPCDALKSFQTLLFYPKI